MTITIDDYINAAKKGDIATIHQYLTPNNPFKTNTHKIPFLPESPRKASQHKRALEAAISNNQREVVAYLLNYKKNAATPLISEEAKRHAIITALEMKHYELALAIIQHLHEVRSSFYTSVRNTLSRSLDTYQPKIRCPRAAANVILALLKHHKLEINPRRALETLRDIGIAQGSIEVIQHLTQAGLKLHTDADNLKSYLLFDLAASPHSELIFNHFNDLFEPLLRDGIHYTAGDNGDTLFIAAASANNLEFMQRILTLDPDQASLLNRADKNALMAAAESNTPCKEAMLFLRTHFNTTAEDNMNLLYAMAGNSSQFEMFEILLSEFKGDIHTLLQPNNGRPSLIDCIIRRQSGAYLQKTNLSPLTPFLMLANELINRKSNTTNHPFLYPAQAALLNPLQVLLQKEKAALSKHDTTRPLTNLGLTLFNQTFHGHSRHTMPPLVYQCNENGSTALHHACINTPRILDYLLEQTAQPTEAFFESEHFAVQTQIYYLHQLIDEHFSEARISAVFDLLISQGAKIEAKNFEGYTPLHIASITNDPHVIDLLLLHGADLEAINDEGATPLMLACQHNTAETIRTLIRHGANAHARDNNGKNILDYLKKNISEVIHEVDTLIMDAFYANPTTPLRPAHS